MSGSETHRLDLGSFFLLGNYLKGRAARLRRDESTMYNLGDVADCLSRLARLFSTLPSTLDQPQRGGPRNLIWRFCPRFKRMSSRHTRRDGS